MRMALAIVVRQTEFHCDCGLFLRFYLPLSLNSAGLANGLGMDVDMMVKDDGPLARGSLLPGLCLMNGGFAPASGFGSIEALARGGGGALGDDVYVLVSNRI